MVGDVITAKHLAPTLMKVLRQVTKILAQTITESAFDQHLQDVAHFQISVGEIEKLTGLRLDALEKFDAIDSTAAESMNGNIPAFPRMIFVGTEIEALPRECLVSASVASCP